MTGESGEVLVVLTGEPGEVQVLYQASQEKFSRRGS